ncbi:ATP-binding protein [Sphingomonas sp. 2R-10]|uniref:ATP-binding protein n=1 Tax=Sphingomonas sp. 2R-10 TaxID=3045148 RepID=UPI0013DDF35C|nr:ATP-binding protein [Sphingomonas sp. 2R-10]MDJ0275401.1 ATP-binding protein [Sphingomonas sp. 2R-10]
MAKPVLKPKPQPAPLKPEPVIQTVQALLALRDSGFTLAAALAEVIDNSIEAKATNIQVTLHEAVGRGGKSYVDYITIVDDGIGMSREVLAKYLVIGFSTRWMQKTTIGKYGVGAKLAALNFGRCIDVWSRESAKGSWQHVSMDLGDMEDAERRGDPDAVTIAPPVAKPVPASWVAKPPSGTGTVVIWSDVDRLEAGRVHDSFDALVRDARKELARIFREFINGGLTLTVNGFDLLAADPLFLMSESFADELLAKEAKAAKQKPRGHYAPRLVVAEEEEIYIKEADASAWLTVTVAPPEVLRERGRGGDALARSLNINESQGMISFVRLKREISYTIVPRMFPGGIKESDRFIGIEVAFDPELDEYFGVRNVKHGVVPQYELRNRIRQMLKPYVGTARKAIQDQWREQDNKDNSTGGEHESVVNRAGAVDKGLPKARAQPLSEAAILQIYRELAKDVGHSDPKAVDEYVERVSARPFTVETVEGSGKDFIDIMYLGGSKVVVRVNKRHKFYREIWARLLAVSEGEVEASDEMKALARRATDAFTLMVIAYARATAMDDDPEQFEELNTWWGKFLDTLMSKVVSDA